MTISEKKKQGAEKKQPEVGRLLRRDQHGRFARANRLGIIKKQPPRQRDARGRFVVANRAPARRRDKKGRFVKAAPVWLRRPATLAIPLIIISTISALYFTAQLNKPIQIQAPVATAAPAPVAAPEPVVAKGLPRSEPTRLRIAKVGIDTSFVSIGLQASGELEVPKRYDVVGWYNRAPTPGEIGPAVVVGHVDRPGGTAVFWRLRELLPGDTFEIDRADGTTAKFKVDQVKLVPQENFPTAEVYGSIDHAGIRLITCGGTFNRTTRKYSHNLIVFGSLANEEKISSANR